MAKFSKQKSVRVRLEEIARTVGPGGQMPSIRQLGSDLGASLATLNAALADMEDRNMIWRRQGSGIFVSPSLLHPNLCLICDPSYLLDVGASPVWSQLIASARERAGSREENLSIHFMQLGQSATDAPITDLLHERLTADIAGNNVQGVLSIGLPHELTRWIERGGVPVVSFGGASNYILWVSGQEVIERSVAELAGRGCRALALCSPQSPHWPDPFGSEMGQVFLDALAAHDLPFREDLAARSTSQATLTPFWMQSFPGQGFDALMRLTERDGLRPDGIISTDDMMTQGILMAMGRQGLRVGEDIHIATHANRDLPALLGWETEITRIEFDPAEIVARMFEALEALLRGETPVGATPAPCNPKFPDYHPPEKRILIPPRTIRPLKTFPPPEPNS